MGRAVADVRAVAALHQAVALIDAKAAKGPGSRSARHRPKRQQRRRHRQKGGGEEKGLAAASAGRVGGQSDRTPRQPKPVEQVQRARRVGLDADDRAHRHQRGEIADGPGQRAEHAKLGAIVAIVGVERIADEAAVAGRAAKQRDLPLELLRGGGHAAECRAERPHR